MLLKQYRVYNMLRSPGVMYAHTSRVCFSHDTTSDGGGIRGIILCARVYDIIMYTVYYDNYRLFTRRAPLWPSSDRVVLPSSYVITLYTYCNYMYTDILYICTQSNKPLPSGHNVQSIISTPRSRVYIRICACKRVRGGCIRYIITIIIIIICVTR